MLTRFRPKCNLCFRNKPFLLNYDLFNTFQFKKLSTLSATDLQDENKTKLQDTIKKTLLQEDNGKTQLTNLQTTLRKVEDKILYNSVIERYKLNLGYRKNKAVQEKFLNERKKLVQEISGNEPIPIYLKYLNKKKSALNDDKQEDTISENEENCEIVHFPFKNDESFDKDDSKEFKQNSNSVKTEDEILFRQKHYDKEKVMENWMKDYENFDDRDFDNTVDASWRINYGTPDPKCAVSKVPCGGCGALLHCKDTSIPGYIPSEIFKSTKFKGSQDLQALICQRCHFLKNYDMALQVRVSAQDYPKILEKIKDNPKALVLLLVDLLDFPCSIWPNIIDIIGNKRPVIIIGNKVDLLPKDDKGYLNRIKNILIESVQNSGLHRINVKHVSLISAKTGYGIEELITTLHNTWRYKGDVYLIGCTNVGKSTLFNTLLQSDFCKIQAVDLVQRATTSVWPGTTLNLLKFPILRPSGWRLYVRTKRLISLRKLQAEENRLRSMQLQKTQNAKYATLIGHIERTFSAAEPVGEKSDIFTVQGNANSSGRVRFGLNEDSPEYKLSKWCFDTPGVVHDDQVLHLLTTEELMLTLPKQIIRPRTFSLKPNSTLFLGGLARIDFLSGPISIRFTVFASENLPVTICSTDNADYIYNEMLGTEFLQVPTGNEERLKQWPKLSPKDEIELSGLDWETSCSDIVLSNAGWVSVTLGNNFSCKLKCWTPESRGIYVRKSILPKAVSLRGRKIRDSPAYTKSKFL